MFTRNSLSSYLNRSLVCNCNSFAASSARWVSRGSFGDAFGHSNRSFKEPDRFSKDMFGQQLSSLNFKDIQLPNIEKNFYTEHPEVTNMSEQQLSEVLEENSLNIVGMAPLPKPITEFHHIKFPDSISSALNQAGFDKPSSIQKISWPVALSGRDLVAVAETGSGKTLGFLLPAFTHLKAQPPSQSGPIVLVLAPARELAMQIADESNKFLKSSGIRTVALYGGAHKSLQMRNLQHNPQIIVATPGRLIDLVSSGSISLQRVSYLVLDEADRMLDMGFEPQLRSILGQIRPDKQMLLWSATWPKEIRALAAEFCKTNPVKVTVGSEDLTANPRITHEIHTCAADDLKERFSLWIKENPSFKEEKSIIFVNTKRDADDLSNALRYEGFKCMPLHGDRTQSEREYAIKSFKGNSCTTLIATDVAGRGLDVKNVNRVINLGSPNNIEDFIHRIGRTARGGQTGIATTFVDYSPVKMQEGAKFVRGLVNLLNQVNQPIPAELHDLNSKFNRSHSGGGGGGGYFGKRGGFNKFQSKRY